MLDSGKVVESGRPMELIENEQGDFAKLWQQYQTDKLDSAEM